MEKTPRYTQKERNMVLGFAAQYKDVIENKRTDAESNRKKDEVWRTIAKEFNSRVYHQRTAKQLRQLYKNMKLLLKKDLSTDGRAESFMDILTAISTTHNNFTTIENKRNTFPKLKRFKDSKRNCTFGSIENIESDVVIIKSEDISDNEQSLKNEMDDDDDDESISNKDIPEVCLEEDDEDNIFNPVNNTFSRLSSLSQQQQQHQQQQHQHNHQQQQQPQSYLSLNPQQNHLHDFDEHKNLEHGTSHLMVGNSDSLLSLAIEERKRKIDLLNAQIEYWKMLTKKLEMSNTNNPITQAVVAGTTCPCHIGAPPATRVNGCNQS